jgi:hypothetical protein
MGTDASAWLDWIAGGMSATHTYCGPLGRRHAGCAPLTPTFLLDDQGWIS